MVSSLFDFRFVQKKVKFKLTNSREGSKVLVQRKGVSNGMGSRTTTGNKDDF
jgi:hypothetical protein